MFKKKFVRLGFALCAAVALTGCRTLLPSLPPADFREPGWAVREGQAVWRLNKGKIELAGEVLVATNPDGRTVVQFSKSPFPLVSAQSTTNRWEVDFPPENRHYSGPGKPPKRLIWLYLPKIIAGESPPRHWSWYGDLNHWRLENRKTGESLEGFFNP